MTRSDADLTGLLGEARRGESRAIDRFLPLVYDELHALAAVLMLRERRDHSLQPTALVHEAYLKLIDQSRVDWRDRAHFLSVAAEAIRRILVDHARGKARLKRGGGRQRLTLDDEIVASFDRTVDLLALDEALERLAERNARQAKIVELRFFGGLTIDEVADMLDMGTASVERDWRYARAVLFAELSRDERAREPQDDG